MAVDAFSYQQCIDHVSQAWDDFVCGFSTEYDINPDCLLVDHDLLVYSVGNAIKDILRMAEWHLPTPNALPDRHKYSGFLAKWIAKIRPIKINRLVYILPSDKTTLPREIIMVNAHFALYVFRTTLEYDIPEPIMAHLLYALNFRDWSGENLALLAYASEEMTSRIISSPLGKKQTGAQ